MHKRLGVIVGAAATTLFTMLGSGSGAFAHAQTQTTQAGPATTAATCYGNTCSGKDPNATGCAPGAQVLADMVILGAPAAKEYLVRLSYSPTCNASWTDIQAINQPDCLYAESIWHEAVNNSTGARTRTASVSDGAACSTYTVMMSRVGRSTRACAHSSWENRDHCTPWR